MPLDLLQESIKGFSPASALGPGECRSHPVAYLMVGLGLWDAAKYYA